MSSEQKQPGGLSDQDYESFIFCDAELQREIKRCSPEDAQELYQVMYQAMRWWGWSTAQWAEYRQALEELTALNAPLPHKHAWILNEIALFVEYFEDTEKQLLSDQRLMQLAIMLETCYYKYVSQGREIPDRDQVTYDKIKRIV